MRLETLEEYIVFAKHLNFSLAAKELYISQPSLSTHIRSLERELGFELVSHKTPLSLTPAGAAFLECAQNTLHTYQSGCKECLRLSTTPPARFLAFTDDALTQQVLQRAKKIPVTLRTNYKGVNILDELRSDNVDIAICFDFGLSDEELDRKKLGVLPFGGQQLALAIPSNHPLALKKSLAKDDLVDIPIFVTDAAYYDCWTYRLQSILGPGSGPFVLKPIEDWSVLAFEELKGVYACGTNPLSTNLQHRGDVQIVNTIEGVNMHIPNVVYYRQDSNNENVLSLLDIICDVSQQKQSE